MRKILALTILLSSWTSFGQIGGNYSFGHLNLPFSARNLALGGDFISVSDKDITSTALNPALLNKDHHKQIAFNQALMAGGLKSSMLNFGWNLKDKIMTGVNFRYIGYGSFLRTDEFGNELGDFHPFDYDLSFSGVRAMTPKWNVGASLRFISSKIDIYNSLGLSLDMGAYYKDEDRLLSAAFLVKNAGYQIKGYNKGVHSPLPIQVQAAITKKLAHAPFRFTLLGHHLNIWDLTYNDPNALPTIDALTGDTLPVKRANGIEKVARHFSYQAEILLGNNLHVNAGFDYHQRKEMRLESKPGMAGFSFGVSMWFKRFMVDYGFGVVSSAGFQHMITLQTNLDQWRR